MEQESTSFKAGWLYKGINLITLIRMSVAEGCAHKFTNSGHGGGDVGFHMK